MENCLKPNFNKIIGFCFQLNQPQPFNIRIVQSNDFESVVVGEKTVNLSKMIRSKEDPPIFSLKNQKTGIKIGKVYLKFLSDLSYNLFYELKISAESLKNLSWFDNTRPYLRFSKPVKSIPDNMDPLDFNDPKDWETIEETESLILKKPNNPNSPKQKTSRPDQNDYNFNPALINRLKLNEEQFKNLLKIEILNNKCIPSLKKKETLTESIFENSFGLNETKENTKFVISTGYFILDDIFNALKESDNAMLIIKTFDSEKKYLG